MTKDHRIRKLLVVLTCLASLLPYALIIVVSFAVGLSPAYRSSLSLALIGGIAWLVLVVATLIVGGWERRLYWLLALFPIAFGPWLLVLYDWLFGYAR